MEKPAQELGQISPDTTQPDNQTASPADRTDRMGRKRSAYATRNLTTGSIPRNLLFIAWPQFIEGFLRILDQIADLVWAGFLGTRAIAGMGVAQQYTQMAFTGRQGIDVSQRAMISRAVGMGNYALANHILWQAWTMTLGFSLIMVVIGLFFTEPLLRLLGLSDEVISQGAPYMRLHFIGHVAIAFQQVSGHALAAAGDTLTLMKATTVARIAHLILSPMFVFGLLGFPEMGLAGAAMGNIIAHSIAVGLLFWVLFRGTSRLHMRVSQYKLDWILLSQMFRLAVPAALNGIERTVSQMVMIFFVAPFGDIPLAAFTITRRVEMFANLGSQGMGLASGVIVGQSLGAGNPDRAKKTVYWAIAYVMLVKSILCVLLFAFPTQILSIFSRDPEFLQLAQTWIRITVLGFLFMGAGQVFQNSFQMAGDTIAPLLITFVSLWGVGIPLAYALSSFTSLGEFGIAWAVVISMILRAVAYIPYFYWGRWLRVRIFTQDS